MNRKRVGILGCGTIGATLARAVLQNAELELAFVFSRSDARLHDVAAHLRVTSVDDVTSREADLVVEAAHSDLVKDVAAKLVAKSDLMLFSVTALADDRFRDELKQAARKSGRRVFLPHGAIVGIDGLVDAGATLQSVTITTTKSPASLGLSPQDFKVVYDGPTRGACEQFPRNVNVHAMIALAGVGFDRTVSRIVADPKVNTNSHLIEVSGTGYKFKIEVSSEAGGKVTGAYTPQSAVSALQRVCNEEGGFRFV
jgi:aspartate dehydrogenase